MTGMLVSVRNLAEARLALRAGADIVDVKEPATGVLGALAIEEIARIVDCMAGRVVVSATTGDIPMHSPDMEQRIMATHSTGVDYVKAGVFGVSVTPPFLNVLGRCTARGASLVLVFFAEHAGMMPDSTLLAAAGIKGVMLDTADKAAGSLRQRLDQGALVAFIGAAKEAGLLCGLAGSLRHADVPALLPLQADYLGFRGALCRQHDRVASLDAAAMLTLKRLFAKQTNTEDEERCYDTVAR